MSSMLGSATRKDRQGGCWRYCCTGHDGKWAHYIKRNRKSQRKREQKEWQNADLSD